MSKSLLSISRRDVIFAVVIACIIVLDQVTKWWIRSHLAPGESLFDIGFFQIIRVENTGVAFGFFQGHPLIFTIFDAVGILVLVTLIFILRRRWSFFDRIPVRVGLGFVLGGTTGNFIDRLHIGHVTDFLDFKVWPVWNVADSSITIGCIILAFCIIFLTNTNEKKA